MSLHPQSALASFVVRGAMCSARATRHAPPPLLSLVGEGDAATLCGLRLSARSDEDLPPELDGVDTSTSEGTRPFKSAEVDECSAGARAFDSPETSLSRPCVCPATERRSVGSSSAPAPFPLWSWAPALIECVLGEERLLSFLEWLIETAPDDVELDATELAEARERWVTVSKDVDYYRELERELERAGRDTTFSRKALRRNELVLRGLARNADKWKAE